MSSDKTVRDALLDTVLNQNNTFGALWLKPSSILQARFFKFSAQLQF